MRHKFVKQRVYGKAKVQSDDVSSWFVTIIHVRYAGIRLTDLTEALGKLTADLYNK